MDYTPGLPMQGDENLFLSNDQALPNNASVDSTVYDLTSAGMLAAKEPVLLAVNLPAVTINASKELDVLVMESADGETWDEHIRWVFPAGTALPTEKIIGLVNPLEFVKLTYTTTDNLSASKVTATLNRIH
jgi:hypothetical protein